MKYFQMNGLIDKEMAEQFGSFYNEHQDSAVTIVMNTGGGGYFQAELIANMINELKDVTIFVQAAYSAGFFILFHVKCKIILSKTARGMWHYGNWSISMSDKGKPYYHEDECILSNMPFHSRESRSIAKKTMNAKEYAKFLKDHDVYFNTVRMKEIFGSKK